MQKNFFGLLTGSDATSGLTLPDLISVASAYGLTALRISDPKDLRKQIANVLQLPGPVVCDVVVTPDEFRAPRLSSKQRADGTMVSSPLEDLWPFLDRDEFKANMLIEPLEQ
jgi:acetolactate synthase-1/2/3 large subunit